ncbi:MAG: tetratricopeptide repeat protein [Chthoniobacterales bacterium]
MSRRPKPSAVRKNSIISSNRWMVFGVCGFIAAITWLVFGQTLGFPFINLDDNAYVVRNAQVARGLTIEGIWWAFTHVHSANWHPLTWLSHMLDCQLYGLNPGGHHFTNVLLHTATAILLFLVLRQMTGALWRSAFVAVFFAIHPLRVESVAWIAERKDVLSGLFFVLTIGAYVRYVRQPSPARYGFVLLLFAFGLMCKPMLITLPCVLLLLDFWPLNRIAGPGNAENPKIPAARRLIAEKLPLFVLGAASSLGTLFAQKVALQPLSHISLAQRTGNAIISYGVYLRQMFWPRDLAPFYPFNPQDVVVSKVVFSLVILAAISTAVFIWGRRYRYLVTGWLWYLIMLLPVIGILQVGSQSRADRYTYLPQIGLALLLTWMAVDLANRWRHRLLFLGIPSAGIVSFLALSAHIQASHWRNSETLWLHTLTCTTGNAIAEENLGQAVYDQGRVNEALVHFQNALQIDPRQPFVHSLLGVAFLEIGRVDDSLTHLKTAIEINPNDGDAHYNLGNTFLQMGRAEKAIAEYSRALEINTDDIEARNNLAWVLATCPDALLRNAVKAVAIAERADSLTRSQSPVIGATLAAAYAEAGRFDDAIKTAQHALQLALNEGQNARADAIRSQIQFYQSGLAFRDNRYTPVTP